MSQPDAGDFVLYTCIIRTAHTYAYIRICTAIIISLQSRHFGLGNAAASVANAQLSGALFGVRVGHLTQPHFDYALQRVLVRIRQKIQHNLPQNELIFLSIHKFIEENE